MFEMTYVAGPRGLPDGTLLRLAFAKAFSLPQTSDRHGPGWIKATETPGRLELASIGQSIESHERVDVIYRLPDGLPSCGRLAFRYRTDFVYLFPSRWAQMERRYWWDPLPPMALAVAVDERHVFVPPLEENGHALEVMAGPPERLHLFLPGRVREGSSTRLTGVFTDRYRNAPSPGPLPSPIHLRLCGEDNRDLGSADGHFDRWYRFALPLPALRPGVYRAQACDSRTGAVLAESNPMEMMRRGDSRSPIFWGEIHAHSEQSDGSGRFEHIYLHGRDEGALDFAAGADHACYFTDNEWTWMQDITNSFNDEPRFVTLVGYEWAGEQGHRNVYTSRDRLDLFRGMDTSSHRLNVVYDHFAGRDDVVAGPHVHHVGKDFFAHHNPDVQRFFEIYSMWGNYERLVFQALNGGAVIGVTGGGDCHEARAGFSVEDPAGQGQTPHTFAPGLRWKCGMTAALLPELTRQALLRALRERQTYATSGARILVDFEVSRVPMGGTGETSGAPRVSALVHGVSRIGRVDVIRNGEVVHSAPGQGADLLLSWSDGSAPRGPHWYMLRIVQQDDEIAWTSPLWLTVR
ncbi:MAG: hypothetical protein FJ279_33830 [Planctomycetes bacterium]|nr:hypothetical protein [Planctomycetota bacterium]